MKKQNIFIESLKALKSVRGIALCAMLIAISCVLGFAKFGIGQDVNITFFFLPISIAAVLLGPFPAIAVGGVSDLLGCIIRPTGPYFPGFTLNYMIIGLVYGIFFYSKKPKLWKIIVARLILAVVIDLVLTPLWLHILYGTPLVWALFAQRIAKCAITCPIEIVLMLIVNNAVYKLKEKIGN